MTGKQEGPYKGEETKAEEDKLWQVYLTYTQKKPEYICDILVLLESVFIFIC